MFATAGNARRGLSKLTKSPEQRRQFRQGGQAPWFEHRDLPNRMFVDTANTATTSTLRQSAPTIGAGCRKSKCNCRDFRLPDFVQQAIITEVRSFLRCGFLPGSTPHSSGAGSAAESRGHPRHVRLRRSSPGGHWFADEPRRSGDLAILGDLKKEFWHSSQSANVSTPFAPGLFRPLLATNICHRTTCKHRIRLTRSPRFRCDF